MFSQQPQIDLLILHVFENIAATISTMRNVVGQP